METSRVMDCVASARPRRIPAAFAALLTVLGLVSSVWAQTTYIYNDPGTANDADTWSSGEDWTGAVPPVRGSTTTLQFGGTLAAPSVWNTTGIVVSSENDLGAGLLNPSGRFDLNQLVMSYRGLNTNTAPNNVGPQFTLQGIALEFVADGATNPVLAFRSNSASAGTAPQKVVLTLANDLYVGAPEITFSSDTNFGGGNAAGNVRLTGTFNWTTTGLHTVNFGGTGGAGNSLGGRAVFAGNIADSGVGAGNATTLVKNGTSFWDLTGTVSHTGGTTVNAGTLRATQSTGLGTGDITVADGGQVWLAGGGTYDNDFFIAGTGPSTSLGTVGAFSGALQISGGMTTGLITLQGNARISTTNGSSVSTPVTTIASQITGAFALTLGNGAGVNQGPMVISNTLNDYTGGTTFLGENRTLGGSNSGSLQTFRLGASEVLPHGPGTGDVLMFFGDQSSQTLDLNGFNETINGLNSGGNGRNGARVIRNNLAATTSELTVGSNDANGSFLGNMIDGSATAKLALTKIGAGTQTLTGTSGYTGDTTVSGGTLAVDYNVFATSQTSAPSNYHTTGSDLVLNGGTFAINGRRDGAAITVAGTGATAQRVLTGIDTTNLAVGQLVDGAGSAGVAAGAYILRIESPTSLSLSANTTLANATIATSATSGTTSQTLKGLTLAGAPASTSILDFGTTGGVFLTFNSAPVQTNDGSLLQIANWSGVAGFGGGIDQLLFVGSPTDFTSVFSQSEVSFVGYGTGYTIIDNLGTYEVSAIPEPTTLVMFVLCGIGLLVSRRRRR